MSRQRQRITRAVESRGYGVRQLDWESIHPGGEKSGLCGGWSLILNRDYLPNTYPGNDMHALNVDELLGEIDYWLEPPEPCACDRTHDPNTAARLINDLERPTHGRDCRFHLRYDLPSWRWHRQRLGDTGDQDGDQ